MGAHSRQDLSGRPGRLGVEDLHVSIERDGDRATLRVAGDIDLLAKETLSVALAQALDAKDIVVDLRAVTFVDSTGIGLFLTMHRFAGQAGRSLSFLGATERVRRTFELAGLTEVLRFIDYDSSSNQTTLPSPGIGSAPHVDESS
jgi:anti-sigma B factor antagonist